MPAPRQLHEEDGFALLEVIVSAALLAVMVIAVFTTFDVANKVSGQEKGRAVAASIAQREIEYLRSLPFTQLSALEEQGTQSLDPEVVDNVAYARTRKATWIPRGTATTSCTAAGTPDRMKVISTVSAPPSVGIKPVTLTTVVAPTAGSFGADQGSLAVTVQNAAGGAQPNVNVTLKSATVQQTRTTDASGCAFFAQQPTGDYNVLLTAPGMVDKTGTAAPSYPATISPETVTSTTYQYDVAGTRTIKFVTHKLDTSGNILNTAFVAAKARNVMLDNSSMTSGARMFGDGTLQTSITATNLFPFTGAYAVYAGDCTGALPATAAAIAPRPAVPTSANATDTTDVIVLMPSVNFTVKNAAGTAAVSGATIKLTARNGTCTGTVQEGGTLTTDSTGRLPGDGATAMPFGTYDYCITDGSKKATGSVSAVPSTGISNLLPTGVAKTVQLSTTGTCP
jgi:hypothetical protein